MKILFSMSWSSSGDGRPAAASSTNTKDDDLPDPQVYMKRFKQHAAECIGLAYKNTVHRTNSRGVLSTSLTEDVLSLIDTQRKVLEGFLRATELLSTREGEAMLADGILAILRCLKKTQKSRRLFFMTTLEDCCAAANDFFRMSDKMESFIEQLLRDYPFLMARLQGVAAAAEAVQQEGSELVSMLSLDSVFAAERAQVFIMRAVNCTRIPSNLFSKAWEDYWTHNEVASELVKSVDGYLFNIRRYLSNEFLYHKALMITCKAVVCFYIRCLVEKADSVGRRRRNRDRLGQSGERKPFCSPNRALIRMKDDIIVIKDFFHAKTKGNVVMTRIVSDDIYVLELIHECLDASDDDSLETFIFVIHKRTGADTLVTRYFVGDLWLLVADHKGKRQIDEKISHMHLDLQLVSSRMKERSVEKKSELSFVRLDEMLRAMYEDRITQGSLPLCWTCLPKVEADGNRVVNGRIRALTRGIAEMRLKHSI